MPNHLFRDAFYQPIPEAPNATKVAAALAPLYQGIPLTYFSTDSPDDLALELTRFRASPEFAIFQAQYQSLIRALDLSCLTLHIQNKVAPELEDMSAFALFEHRLFVDVDFFSTRAALLFDEGKRDLEEIYMHLQDPHISQDKKKEVLATLQLSLIVCADGSLSAITDAKHALTASQNAQQLCMQAKHEVIQQIAVDFCHIASHDNYKSTDGMEVHNVNHLIDSIAMAYGLPLKQDRTQASISQQARDAFSSHLSATLKPALILECLFLHIHPLFLSFHQQVYTLLQPSMPLHVATYQSTYEARVNKLFEAWGKQYGAICPIDVSTVINCEEEHVTFNTLNLALFLKVTLSQALQKHIFSDAAPSYQLTLLPDDEGENHATLRYEHGIFWQEQDDMPSELTPTQFLTIAPPIPENPCFMVYWMVLDALLQQFPTQQQALLSQQDFQPLLQHDNAIWQLAERQCFSLIRHFIDMRKLTPSHLMQRGMLDEDTDATTIWLCLYHRQYTLFLSLLEQQLLSPILLESAPTRGYFAGTMPLWFLTVNRQFHTIHQLLNLNLLTRPQLELNEAALAGSRLAIVWLLALLKEYKLLSHMLEQQLISAQQLQRTGLLPGELMHTNTPALLAREMCHDYSSTLAAQLLEGFIEHELIHAPHLYSISTSDGVITGTLLWILAELDLFHLIERLLDQGHLRTEHFLESQRTGKQPLLLKLADVEQYGLIQKLIRTPGLITPEIMEAPSVESNPGTHLLWLLGQQGKLELIQTLLEQGLITPIQLCSRIPSKDGIIELFKKTLPPTERSILLRRLIACDLVVVLGNAMYAKTPWLFPLNTLAEKLSLIVMEYAVPCEPYTIPMATLLHMAARNNKPDHLTWMLDIDPSLINAVDATPTSRKTALHHVAEQEHIRSAQILLRAGAKIDIPDANGVTAADIARDKPRLRTLFLDAAATATELPPGRRTPPDALRSAAPAAFGGAFFPSSPPPSPAAPHRRRPRNE